MPYYRLFYHFIWATKGRIPSINDGNRQAIYAAIATKVIGHRGLVHAIGGTADHVHLIVTLPPSMSPAALVAGVKGASSHLAARLGDGEPSQFAWQAEYGVVSVSEPSLARVVAYVQNQERHHGESDLVDALESC
ncbi:MAG: IS200/IS605 family transposase [Chloroflexota bacterium]